MQDTPMDNKPVRGPISAQVRQEILDLHSKGFTPEDIAGRTFRSLTSVTKILGEPATAESASEGLDLDSVIDFLALLPEESLGEVVELSQLTRQTQQLRGRLLQTLSEL